jgi:dihydroorotate dehydrogenase (NAD+) catalytic subunit
MKTEAKESERKRRGLRRGGRDIARQLPDLTVDLGFLRLRNPVLAASGTFGYGLEFKPFVDLNKLGGIVVKGLYFNPRPGNPPPRLAESASGLINSIGLQGIGVRAFCEKILPQLQGLRTPIIVNVCGETDEEYAAVIDCLNKDGRIAAYELNISCPNVKKEGRCPALSPDHTFSLVKLAKETSRRPLVVKLSPNVTDIVSVARAAEEAGADAISLINTLLAMAVNIETRRPRLANTFGGLSGPAIKPIALRMVYQVASQAKIPVIGMGGIMNGQDALEFLVVGARAVEVGTANLVDPGASLRILKEISEFCREKKIKKIDELIGSLKKDE